MDRDDVMDEVVAAVEACVGKPHAEWGAADPKSIIAASVSIVDFAVEMLAAPGERRGTWT